MLFDPHLLNPSSRVASQQELPRLVVAEDQDGEGDGGQPPVELERVHPEPLVHARGVAENVASTVSGTRPKFMM